MINPAIIENIRTDPFLKYLYHDVVAFDAYLDDTSNLKIGIKGLLYDPDDTTNVDAVQYSLKYIHRWTKEYDNKNLEKLYNLQYYFLQNPDMTPAYTMMLTLTGTHASPRYPKKGGLDHMAYLDKFHEAHRKSKDLSRKYLGTRFYLSMLEGHPESGYAHAHDLYFLDECPSEKTLKAFKNHWNKKLGMGSSKHGMTIEIREPQNFRDIKSFIAYPMAYIGKSTIGDLSEWTKYDVIFNTCLWLAPKPVFRGGINQRVRAFQPSHALSKIMNRPKHNEGFIHIETELTNKLLNESKILCQDGSYETNMKAWLGLGGDTPTIQVEDRPL